MTTRSLAWGLLLALNGAGDFASAAAPEVTGATLTLRGGGKATVVEQRRLRLSAGEAELRWEGVSQNLDRDSLQLRFLEAPVAVFGQRYEGALTNRDALLTRYLGKRIKLVRRAADGREIGHLQGILLSVNGARPATLELDSGEVLVDPPGELVLPPLPGGLPRSSSVVWTVRSPEAGEATAEMSYITDRLKWQTHYVMTLDRDLEEAEIAGWVTLTNQTGVTFRDATVRIESLETRKIEALQPVTETEIIEFPLSELDRPITLPAEEPLRIPLLTTRVVPLEQVFLFDPQGATPAGPTPPQKLKHLVRIHNTAASGLGVNLPGGRALVYQESDKGTKLRLDTKVATAANDKHLEIVLGDVANVEGSRKQTAFREVAERTQEQDIEIRLNNKTDEWVEVVAVEHPWPQWQIMDASHPHQTRADKAIEFPVMLAPKAVTTVTYRVRMKY